MVLTEYPDYAVSLGSFGWFEVLALICEDKMYVDEGADNDTPAQVL